MSTATIILLPDSPCSGPMFDLFSALSRQSLLDPVWLMRGDQSTVVCLEPGGVVIDGTSADVLQEHVERFCVVNVITADVPVVPPVDDQPGAHFAKADQLGRAIEEALAIDLDGKPVQEVRLVNLLAPTAQPASVSTAAWEFGTATAVGWTNVVLAPEVQSDSTAASALVDPDHRYIANTVCGIASLVGLWVTASEPSLPPNSGRGSWHLARTRMRMLAAPELAQRVVNRAARRDPPLPQDGFRQYRALEGSSLDQVVDRAVDAIVTHHRLVAVAPPTEVVQRGQRTPGARALLKLIGQWIRRRLPELVKEEVAQAGRQVVGWMEERVNGAFQTEDLEVRFTFLKGSDDQPHRSGGTVERSHPGLLVPMVSPEPELWSNLRSVVFGLIDGSPLPLDLEPTVTLPSTRFIVCARSRLVPAPTEPLLQGPTDLGRSVVGRLAYELDRGVSDARGITADFSQQLAELRAETVPQHRSRLARIGRFILRVVLVVLKVAVAVAVTVGLVVLPFLLPVAGLLFVAWFVAGSALWLFAVFRAVAAFVWTRFRRDFQRSERITREQLLELGLLACQAQEDRFEQLRAIGLEWCKILGFVVHHPFGPPLINERPRVHREDLRLPPSHQVVEPHVSDLRMEGVVNHARKILFPTGWLATRFADLEDAVGAAFKLQSPGSEFQPDRDGHDDGVGQRSGRRVLYESLLKGRATARNEILARQSVEQTLLSPEGLPGEGELEDRLFTWADSRQRPSAFLEETTRGEPAKWNRGLVAGGEGGQEAAERKIERVVADMKPRDPLPSIPSVEQIIEGMKPDYQPFVLGGFCVEVALNVPASVVVAFAEVPTPASIDLESANSLWQPPPPVDEGEVRLLDDEERAGLGIPDDALPQIGELVRPNVRLQEPTQGGAYSFMLEVDGDPVQWSSERPVKYLVRQAAAPPNGMSIVLHCLQRVADATGLAFEFGGTVTGVPSSDDGDAVFIAWSYDAEFREHARAADLSGEAIGFGGPRFRIDSNGQPVMVAGVAVLNTEMAYEQTIGSGRTHGAVLLHELGHVMNLGHVSESGEVMYPYSSDSSVADWGPGDRLGLFLSVGRLSPAIA